MNGAPFTVRRAGERYRTDQPGISTWHCFSSGSHYYPDNVGFGALVTCDEHTLAAGAGFAMHRHAGVVIVSWPLAGALRHESEDGAVHVVPIGTAQVLHAGPGVAHSEFAGPDEAVRFLQLVFLAHRSDPAGYGAAQIAHRPVGRQETVELIAAVATPGGPATVSVVRAISPTVRWDAGADRFAIVVGGSATLSARADEFLAAGSVELAPGDSARIGASVEAELTAEAGPVELVVVTLS